MNEAYLLWFVQKSDRLNGCELLIGVYSAESEAKGAIERVKDQPGFAEFPEGLQIHPYRLNHDNWTQGFKVDQF